MDGSEISFFKAIIEAAREVGLVNALFIAFFLMAHTMIFYLYKANINGKQKEIDNIREENDKLREFSMKLLDDKRKEQ